MKVLHFSSAIYPFQTGGTEVFIENLLKEQKSISGIHDILWAIHDVNDLKNSQYNFNNENKMVINCIKAESRLHKFSGDCYSIKSFKDLLDIYKPDIVHLHDFNHRCGVKHAKAVKDFKSKLVISIHTTPCSCLGNKIFYDKPNLNGLFNDKNCTSSRLNAKGIPKFLAEIISLQDGFDLDINNENIFARVLTSKKLTHVLHENYTNYLKMANKIHVCAKWTEDLISKQGFSKNKIFYQRAGISEIKSRHKRKLMEDGFLKLVFLGRCDEKKGVHLIIKAIKKLKINIPIQLDIYTRTWESEYCKNLSKLIDKDKRFKIFLNLKREYIFTKLDDYDLLVIPSLWLETGPLVALEALASRIPVAGTSQGGIKEILENIDKCYLVKPKIKSWVDLFNKLIIEKGSENEVKSTPEHTFKDVANFMMKNLYI